MATRTERALIRDGAAWVRVQREGLGWSPRKLAIRAWMMLQCSGVSAPAPTAADIIAFEAGEVRYLPRWLIVVQDVFAFMELPPEERQAWVDRRSWRDANHPLDLSEALLFRDEAMLLDDMRRMDEGDRRAWRAFVGKWPMRSRERDRVGAAREWLRRMDIAVDALLDDERQLLEDFRRLPVGKRAELAEAVREQAIWPPLPPMQLEEDEMELIAGYATAGEVGRHLMRSIAREPDMMHAVIEAVKAAYLDPEEET